MGRPVVKFSGFSVEILLTGRFGGSRRDQGLFVTQTNPYAAAPQTAPAWGQQATISPYPPQYAQPQWLATAAPKRGGISGRTSLIALATVVALLGAGGFAYSASKSDNKSAAPVVIHKKAPVAAAPSATPSGPATAKVPAAAKAAVPAKKPAAKAAPAPVNWVEITKANSGTAGASYQLAAPKDYTFERGKGVATSKSDHLDVYMYDGNDTVELGMLSYAWEGLPNGTLPPELVRQLRKSWLTKGKTGLGGTSVATIGGIRATGFDYTRVDTDGTKMRVRMLFFGHGGTLHTAVWFAPEAGFAATIPAFQHIVATLKFTGVSTRHRATTTGT